MVILELEDDGSYTLINKRKNITIIVCNVKDKDTALLVKKVYIDGLYDGIALLNDYK